jgi:hypothetical protein
MGGATSKDIVPAVTVADTYGSVALVSAVWVLFAYSQMPFGPISGMIGRSPGHVQWGNRIFGNLNEQSVMFMVSMWLYAVFINAEAAALNGWVYLGFRTLYPTLWLLKGGEAGPPFPLIFVSTFSAYGVNVWHTASIVAKFGLGVDLLDVFMGSTAVGYLAATAAFYLYAMKVVPVLSTACTPYFAAPPKAK